MIFQIYVLLAPLVAKASTDRYGAGKAESRNLNMENGLPKNRQATEEAVLIAKKVTKKASRWYKPKYLLFRLFCELVKYSLIHTKQFFLKNRYFDNVCNIGSFTTKRFFVFYVGIQSVLKYLAARIKYFLCLSKASLKNILEAKVFLLCLPTRLFAYFLGNAKK